MKNSKSLKLTVSETQTRNEKAPQASYVALQGPEKYAQLLGDKKEALIRSHAECIAHEKSTDDIITLLLFNDQ